MSDTSRPGDPTVGAPQAEPSQPDPSSAKGGRGPSYERLVQGSFEAERHFYPRVLNAQLHPLVRFFLILNPERIISRYCHLNPRVAPEVLAKILETEPRYFRWSGADLLHVTTEAGRRHMVVVETNSCPSGQKSMPSYDEHDEEFGYRKNLERAFMPMLRGRRLPPGELAVIYDKNPMEASGYAAAMADLFDEHVHLVEFPDGPEAEARVRFVNGVLEIRDDADAWIPIRCAFRYVTQRPWNRIPVHTKTVILNPVISCLAGGRNKMVAAKAYDFYNGTLMGTGLAIRTPQTTYDVSKREIPLWVQRLGGHAVIKVPYSNAGQGVYTITCSEELDAFMALEQRYDRFIVQSLIGNAQWSSHTPAGRLYHVGTVPNKKAKIFVSDLRMMVCAGPGGFRPLVIYARRARSPLMPTLGEYSSWDMLGTNLSIKRDDGGWDSDTGRLLLMDRKDFNALGVGIDELIEAYIQTVLSTLAIDQMAQRLINKRGTLRTKLFKSLNDDDALIREIMT
ncbi:hypothetical protein ENSA5_03620 [Enhygromyxa salina]|uniref:Uncharacterized protein n=1 Tax=Enhygromyxa salina TaxID=215803 RepID=A0A2S9YK02_9BACT|nr:hypothetical protein [Enhygromyxa salina]PRQ05372.1 hypothetical protein ENSA5_03620 [Enhygromyxa salina]